MPQYTVKLTLDHSTHNIVKTKVIEGVAFRLPTIGRGFQVFSPDLQYSLIHTSWVKEAALFSEKQDPNTKYVIRTYIFKTHNSTYILEISKEEE